MKKPNPPAHIIGAMPNDASEDLKLERAKWITAQSAAGYTPRQIAAALKISTTRVHKAAEVGRDLAPTKQAVGLPRASWEDLHPAPRLETEPRFSLVRAAPPEQPNRIDQVIGFIRELHAEFMADRAA